MERQVVLRIAEWTMDEKSGKEVVTERATFAVPAPIGVDLEGVDWGFLAILLRMAVDNAKNKPR